MIRLIPLVFPFFVVSALADWREDAKTYENYKAQRAAATTASDFEALEQHPHCQRPETEWVGTWCLQTAAWRSHKAGDRLNAERLANWVLLRTATVKAQRGSVLGSQRARALTILAHWRAIDRKWDEAALLYQEAEDLDPDCAATDGLGNLREAKKIGG